MPLADNLSAAQQAVSYVKTSGILASNKVQDRLRAAGGVDRVISAGAGYDNTAAAGVSATRAVGLPSYTIANLRTLVGAASRNRYGNCGEQAMMALLFLYDRGVRPLDLMTFGNPTYDHMWTCVGLAPGWQRTNLRSWGPDAVWCDPWQGDGVAFPIDDLVKGKVRNLNAIYKCNTAERVEQGNPTSVFHA